jgi:hypothetical protein
MKKTSTSLSALIAWHRDVVGIAGTDADDKNLSHLQASSTIRTGQHFAGKEILPKPGFGLSIAVRAEPDPPCLQSSARAG